MDISKEKSKLLLSKVPEVTIFFWVIKILCTTVGETFSDFINVNLGLGLTLTTVLMGIAFFVVIFIQFKAAKYVPWIYWLTVVLISVFGTLVTDNLTDALGVPLELSTIVFSILLGLTFLVWYINEKTLSIHSIFTIKREVFYWLVILFTFALGTAVGDLYSEQLGLGYLNTGIIVAISIICVLLAWRFLKLNSVLAFWIAYIFTRPLGASLGDYLSQPKLYGGLGLGAAITSLIFLTAILIVVIYLAISKCDIRPKEIDQELNTNGNRKKVLIQTIIVICLFLIVFVGGYFKFSNNIVSKNESSSANLQGQLNDFISIENDMINLVNSSDYAALKTKADELEHDWDVSEPKLRKIDSRSWTQIDGTIDDVLSETRSSNLDTSKCKSTIQTSLDLINKTNTGISK